VKIKIEAGPRFAYSDRRECEWSLLVLELYLCSVFRLNNKEGKVLKRKTIDSSVERDKITSKHLGILSNKLNS
jgi:hypothetical protein